MRFSYQKKENVYYVSIPNHRSDITNNEELLEELLRIYDYNKIVISIPSKLESVSFNSNKYDLKVKNLRSYLTSCG